MAHHKRGRSKAQRAGCLMCKPSKLNANKTSDRMKARKQAFRYELDNWNGSGYHQSIFLAQSSAIS